MQWRTRTVLTVCVLFAVLGITSVLVSVRAERRAMRFEHLRSVARMGTAAIQSADEGGRVAPSIELFRRWSWTAMTGGQLLGAALFGADGQLLDVQPQDLATVDAVADTFARGATSIVCAKPIGRVAFVGRQIRDKPSVWVIAARAQSKSPLGSTVVTCAAIVTVVLLLTLVLLRRSFDRMVLTPLMAIQQATRGGGEPSLVRLPTSLADEFGELARNVARMIEENRTVQSRMGHMERTMDARVADQTKRIQGMLRQAKKQAWMDPLTGLGNRRLLDDRLEELFDTQRANGEDLSVIMFDLDNFKGLNDTLGHAAGDEVLGFVGELLRCSLRPSDIGLRSGGDEFVVILLDTDADEAKRTAERFAQLFAQRASLFKVSPRVSLSAGVASINRHDPENGAGLMALADAGLYQAKRAGKGVVNIVDNTPIPVASGVR